MTTPGNDAFDQIVASCEDEAQLRAAIQDTPPIIRIYDGDWRLRSVLAGYIECEFTWKYNDVGNGHIVLPISHPLVEWLLDERCRPNRNIHIAVDKNGARWSGKVIDVNYGYSKSSGETLELICADDIAELQKIHVWPNWTLPAGFQAPKYKRLVGPAKSMLKIALFTQLLRLNSSAWHIPDNINPIAPETWTQHLKPWNWAKLVMPGSIIGDSSQWCVINARFDEFLAMAQPILADCGLMLTYRRWLTGDPPPYPGAIINRNGQLYFDIVDKSGVYVQTSTGGNIVGGLWRTITKPAENAIEEFTESILEPVEPEQYTRPLKWLIGTLPAQPWVVYYAGFTPGIEAANFHQQPSQATQINTGGHSAPGVNEAIGLSVKLIGNMLGAFFLSSASVGNIADTLVKPFYEDVYAAFMSFKSPLRATRDGWDHYEEAWTESSSKAYTLSAASAIRVGLWNTRPRKTHDFDIGSGAPYVIGDNGKGHFFLGDRIGVGYKRIPRKTLFVDQVQEITYTDSRDNPNAWKAVIGDPEAAESPLNKALRQIRRVSGFVKSLGVI